MLSVLGTQSIVVGSGSTALTIPSGTKAIVITVSERSGASNFPAVPSLGGLSFSYVPTVNDSGDRSIVCWREDISGRSNDTLTQSWATTSDTVVYYIGGNVPLYLDDTVTDAGTATHAYGTPPVSGGNIAVFQAVHAHSTFGTISNDSSITTTYSGSADGRLREQGYRVGAANAAVSAALDSTSGTLSGFASVALYESIVSAVLTPDAMEAVAEIPAGVVMTSTGPAWIAPFVMEAVAEVVPGLMLNTDGPLGVMLTSLNGEVHKVLVLAEGETIVGGGTGPPSSGTGGGASALDDLTDVDAPSPFDGDVLTWDDGAGEWVAEPPGTPTLDWGEDADITTLDYDDVADAGALDEAARADHRHGMPSAGGSAAGMWVPVMDGYGNVVTDSGTGAAIMALIT